MTKILLIILLIFGAGCAARRGTVTKTPEGVIFDMESDGKLTYKDKDVEAEMDTRKKAGIIEAIIQMWTLRELEGK